MNTACSDEVFYTNEIGSSIEIKKKVKISEFSLDSIYWKTPDSVSYIKVTLQSLKDNLEKVYDVEIQKVNMKRVFRLMIPKSERIIDGDYLMKGAMLNGLSFGHNFKVRFKDEMLGEIKSVTVSYGLKGEGTKENPYKIASDDDFDNFRFGLYKDSLTHGAGLYFLQTADIKAIKSGINNDHMHSPEAFAGIYDGGGNQIQFSINQSHDVAGLFTVLYSGAEFCNVNLLGSIVNAGNMVGLVAGKTSGTVKIHDVTVENTSHISSDASKYIGGLLGYVSGNLEIADCIIGGQFKGVHCVGGLVGFVEKGKLTVTNVSNGDNKNFEIHSIKSRLGFVAGFVKGSIDFENIQFNSPKRLETTNHLADVGGLVGHLRMDSICVVKDIDINTPIYGYDFTGACFGYVCGKNEDNSILKVQNVTLHNSITGNVKAGNEIVQSKGGIVGGLDKAVLFVDNVTFDNFELEGGNQTGFVAGYVNEAGIDLTQIKFINQKTLTGKQYTGGLIGKAILDKKSQIKDVEMNSLVVGTEYVGGLFGSYFGDFKSAGTIKISGSVKGDEYVGGICGEMQKGDIKVLNKYFNLDDSLKVKGSRKVGGLFGFVKNVVVDGDHLLHLDKGSSTLPTSDSYTSIFKGSVTDKDEKDNGCEMGGIVGYAEDSNVRGFCFTGSVKGNSEVGGIIGRNYNTLVSSCINNSKLCKGKGNNVGGIVGEIRTKRSWSGFDQLLNYGLVEGQENTGGIIGAYFVENNKDRFEIYMDYLVNIGDVSGKIRVGGCVGLVYSDDNDKDSQKLHLKNSANYGKVSNYSSEFSSSDDIGNAGGILGDGLSNIMYVYGCVNHGEVSGNTSNYKDKEAPVGGIVGHLGIDPTGSSNSNGGGLLSSCCNFGDIHALGESNAQVGGLIGYKEEGNSDGEIQDCYNAGKITSASKNDNNGGIVGFADWNIEIYRCYNVGNVKDGSGIVGDSKATSHPGENDCFILKESDSETKDKYCKSDSQMKDKSTFTNYNFNKCWDINNLKNNGYPYLKKCPFQFVTK